MTRLPLPIDEVLPELLEALRTHASVVLQAPTGAGKTTRVPPALLAAGLAGAGRIVMLEPRRLAARAAARRMAQEFGCHLGDEIGYQVRFDDHTGPRTRIAVVTEGILVRMLQDDPFLERIGAVVFDEFHERTLQSDLALAMVRQVQQTVRADLKLVVMSATLTAQPLAQYLGDCPIVESAGRLFPVEIRYIPASEKSRLAERAAGGVREILDLTPGDVLVFLPGVGEIRQTANLLAGLAAERNLAVMELYGDLPPERQDAVLLPALRRKIVLATNVAETSVTIAGITGVVDTGQARILKFDPALGLDRLALSRISRASAAQRTGRAGRTQPGLCLRLWSEREQLGMSEHEDPEIRRVDLSGPVLELACWGETDLTRFPWFEPPREKAVERTRVLLERLGALQAGQPTDLGRRMARLPVQPRIGRLLLEGQRLGNTPQAALAAALLSERDPFLRSEGPGRPRAVHVSQSDVVDRVHALDEFDRHGRRDSDLGSLNPAAAGFVLRARDQLLRLLGERSAGKTTAHDPHGVALRRSILAAFPDRVARRREQRSRRGLMVGGRGVRLGEQSAVGDAELFVCVDVDAGKSESLVRLASAIERDWLPAERVQTTVEVEFDPEAERIVAFRRVRFEDLLLDEAATSPPAGDAVALALAEAAGNRLEQALPLDRDDVARFLGRVRCLREWMPELDLPVFDEDQLRGLLPQLCAGCRSFAELRKRPLEDHLRGLLTYAQQQTLDREAPERLPVPSGSRIALRYEAGRPPVLAARIQELFGWAETPRIAGGRVRVLLHLLAPNQRPQQITEDLRSFWNDAYQQVRKDLRRRYPKHAWPEDPWNALPEYRPGRRSS